MTEKRANTSVVARRAELLAELFLQSLKPSFLGRPNSDVGFDFLIGFANAKGGVNTFGVEVKGTDRAVPNRFSIDRSTYRRVANSSPPAFVLVVDVKQNRLFYAWPDQHVNPSNGSKIDLDLTEIRAENQGELRKQLTSFPAFAA
jgi:hypothetical protein